MHSAKPRLFILLLVIFTFPAALLAAEDRGSGPVPGMDRTAFSHGGFARWDGFRAETGARESTPLIQITVAPTTGDVPLTVSFSLQVQGGVPPYAAEWDFGDGSAGSGMETTHTYTQGGIYMVTIKLTDSQGNFAYQSGEVQAVDTSPKPLQALMEITPRYGLAPLPVQVRFYTQGGTPPFSFEVDFGDGSAPATPQEPVLDHTYADPGRFTVQVDISDAQGLSKTIQADVLVKNTDGMNQNMDEMEQMNMAQISDMATFTSSLQTLARLADELFGFIENSPESAQYAMDEARQKAVTLLGSIFTDLAQALGNMVSNPGLTKEVLLEILDHAGVLARQLSQYDIGFTNAMLENLEEITSHALWARAFAVMSRFGVSAEQVDNFLEHPDILGQYLQNHPHQLQQLKDSVRLPMGAEWDLDRAALIQQLLQVGYSKELISKIRLALPTWMDAGHPVGIGVGGNSVTAREMVEKIWEATSYLDPVSGNIKIRDASGNEYSFSIKQVEIVPDSFPDGIHVLPDGTRIGIKGRLAIEMVPAACEPVNLAAELINLGIGTYMAVDGRLFMINPAGTRGFSLQMGWRLFGAPSFQAGTTSFGVTGTDPSSAGFSTLVTYENGTTQTAVPCIMAENDMLTFLESALPEQYNLDAETGILDLTSAGLGRLKPDWAFESLSGDLTALFDSIQSQGGLVYGDVAFELEDTNADGWMDFIFYSTTPAGRQVLYTLAQ